MKNERFSCFIIMPYSEESDRIYREVILPAVNDINSYNILMLRADEMGQTSLTLKAHIQNAVSSADFCIADLTGLNPNVMYELGYASSLKKPTIIISQESVKPPANISEIDVIYKINNLLKLRSQLTEKTEKVVEFLRETRITEVNEIGRLLLFDRSIMRRFFHSIQKRLFAIVQSPGMIIENLMPILSAKQKNVQIQLTCVDPDSEFVRFIARDRGIPLTIYRDKMLCRLNELYSLLRKEVKDLKIELRVTENFIANSIYIADDQVLIFPYTTDPHDSLVIIVNRLDNQKIFNIFQHQALDRWEQSIVFSHKLDHISKPDC